MRDSSTQTMNLSEAGTQTLLAASYADVAREIDLSKQPRAADNWLDHQIQLQATTALLPSLVARGPLDGPPLPLAATANLE